MKDVQSNARINGSRLWDSLMEMAQKGPGLRGGNNRQTLTDADKEGRDLFKRWCEEAGMTVGVDSMGNMFARLEGAEPDLDPVMMGSHLDTQPTGGKYDGVLGVLAGLEVVRSIRDLGINPAPSHRCGQLDQRRRHAFCPSDAGLGRFCRCAYAGLGL